MNGSSGKYPASGQDNDVWLSRKDIVNYYKEGCKKPKDVVIGMEVEKHGINQETHQPITYFGPKGLKKIQKKMIEELGWRIVRKDGNFWMALERCGSHLTLESAQSMSELSGRTHPSIHDLARELKIHQHEESVISKIYGTLWLGIGVQPFAKNSEIKPLKCPRYKALYRYCKSRGGLWEEDWKKIASVQANIDYSSEADARKKFQILLRLSPFLSAMYAHSPLNDGKLTGFVSYRTHVLTHNDASRFGIRKSFFDSDFGFEKWIDFCMDIPLALIYRNGKWINPKNLTFRQFFENGYEDFRPTLEDWVAHTGFVYTFVRLKKYIEARICDSVPSYLVSSIQAIVKAFVYHKDGERILKELTKSWSFEDFEEVYEKIAKKGMEVEVRGKKLLEYCREIINHAGDNLKSFKVLNDRKDDESIYLRSIKDFVFIKEMSPGQYVAEQWEGDWGQNPERLIKWCRYE